MKKLKIKVNSLKAILLPNGSWCCGLVKTQPNVHVVLYPCIFGYVKNKSLNAIEIKFNVFDPVTRPTTLKLDNLGICYNIEDDFFIKEYVKYVSEEYKVSFE